MKYDEHLIVMHGVIVEVQDGAVAMDFKGRLGYLKVPLRMILTDYALEVGQEVAFKMSFPEVVSDGQVNEKYVKNNNNK